MRRIARGQIDLAVELLESADGCELDEAIHESRKAFKRVRALVCLARDALGDETYRRENETFRDAGRALASVRDARVMVDTLEDLTGSTRWKISLAVTATRFPTAASATCTTR